jgi:hypothetical protein
MNFKGILMLVAAFVFGNMLAEKWKAKDAMSKMMDKASNTKSVSYEEEEEEEEEIN